MYYAPQSIPCALPALMRIPVLHAEWEPRLSPITAAAITVSLSMMSAWLAPVKVCVLGA